MIASLHFPGVDNSTVGLGPLDIPSLPAFIDPDDNTTPLVWNLGTDLWFSGEFLVPESCRFALAFIGANIGAIVHYSCNRLTD